MLHIRRRLPLIGVTTGASAHVVITAYRETSAAVWGCRSHASLGCGRRRSLVVTPQMHVLRVSWRFQSTNGAANDEVPNAMPLHEDLYARLGLTRGCDVKDIKSNYRKLAKKYHPDHNVGNKDAEEMFKRVNEAYEVLSDSDKRRVYDATGRAPNASGPGWNGAGAYYTYSYSTHLRQSSPIRFYMGLFASAWLCVMIVRWIASGSLASNLWTFTVMLFTTAVFNPIVASCVLFYLYAPSPLRRRPLGDAATVLLESHFAPDPRIKPSRTVRLTGVNRKVLEEGGYVKFTCHWDGSLDPLVVASRPGEAWAALPPTVGMTNLRITASLIDSHQWVMDTVAVDLS